MNERVKELYRQAYGVQMSIDDFALHPEEEKFAELIVRECLRRIEGCTIITTQQLKPYTEFEQGYDKAINKVYSQVKLHFGVK